MTCARIAALLCAAALLASFAQAATLHVPSEYPTIQAGIEAATSGDTVLIACGTYFESGLVLPHGVVLAGDGNATCAVIDGGQHGSILTIMNGVPNAMVRNLTFRNGLATYGGGAIRALGFTTIEDCRFENNYAQSRGGAIYGELYGGNVKVLDCEFEGNSTYDLGGAVDLSLGSALVRGCRFESNTVVGGGGGLAAKYGEIVDCWFESNEAGVFGGGLWLELGFPGTGILVHFCTFVRNSSGMDGGGASTNTSNASSILNCWFEQNTAGRNGGGLHVYNSDTPTAYCVFLETMPIKWVAAMPAIPRMEKTMLPRSRTARFGGIQPVSVAASLARVQAIPASKNVSSPAPRWAEPLHGRLSSTSRTSRAVICGETREATGRD